LVWLRAVLLVMVATALGAGIVFVMRGWHAPAPAAAPQSTSPDSAAFLKEEALLALPFYGPNVCSYIRSGHTAQQAVEATQQNSSLTLEQARAEVNEAIRTYCS
jgi:hypothetical protein